VTAEHRASPGPVERKRLVASAPEESPAPRSTRHLSPIARFVWLDEVDSTNAYAARQLSSLSHGTFVVADRQSAGCGRDGRSWYSPPGGIYMSAVVKSFPAVPASSASGFLTLAMALAVCDGLDRLGLKPVLKWPNDVFVEGEKIAGVLAQATYEGERLSSAVVGVGINVNASREELSSVGRPATSIAVCLGQPQDARDLTYTVAERFFQRLDSADCEGLRRDVLERMVGLEGPVMMSTPRGTIRGRAMGLAEDFQLRILDETGCTRLISAGDSCCSMV